MAAQTPGPEPPAAAEWRHQPSGAFVNSPHYPENHCLGQSHLSHLWEKRETRPHASRSHYGAISPWSRPPTPSPFLTARDSASLSTSSESGDEWLVYISSNSVSTGLKQILIAVERQHDGGRGEGNECLRLKEREQKKGRRERKSCSSLPPSPPLPGPASAPPSSCGRSTVIDGLPSVKTCWKDQVF